MSISDLQNFIATMNQSAFMFRQQMREMTPQINRVQYLQTWIEAIARKEPKQRGKTFKQLVCSSSLNIKKIK